MKIILTIFLATLAFSSLAQWSTPDTNGRIFYNGGNIGIGTTGPDAKLKVTSNSTHDSPALFIDGGGDAQTEYVAHFLGRSSNFPSTVLRLASNRTASDQYNFIEAIQDEDGTQSTAFLVSGNGSVGIGTADPNAKLEIFGPEGLRLTNSAVAGDYMTIKPNQDVSGLNPGFSTVSALITNRRLGHLVFDIHANDNGDSFAIRTDKDLNGEVDEISMVVKPTGNVGIGTTAPSSRLQVSGTTTLHNEGDGAILLDLKSERAWRFQQKGTGPSACLELFNYGGLNKNFSILTDGKVGIGTPTPDAKLTVKGSIHAEEVRVDLNVPGPDYVFEKDYNLPTLDEIKAYIDEHKHLPEVPSAKEMEEKGINVGAMNMILLKKVEELTLHLISQSKQIGDQLERIEEQQQIISSQNNRIEKLEKALKK